MSSSLYAKLFFLWLAVFIDLLGFGIVIPILPFLANDLVGSEFSGSSESLQFMQGVIYGILVASFSFMQFIMAPIWGSISDRIGRRPVLLIGLGGAIIGFGIFGLSTQLWVLFASRVISGIFTSATLTVATAYAADITTLEQRRFAFGILTSGFGLGFALGPVIGGLLISVQIPGLLIYATPGFFAALLCLVNLIGAIFILKESLPDKIKANPPKFSGFALSGIKALFKYKSATSSIAFYSLATFAFSQYIVAFSQYIPLKNSSLGIAEVGFIFSVTGIALFVTQIFALNVFSNWLGEKNVLIIGTILIAIGFILVFVATTLLDFILISLPLAVGIGVVTPIFNSFVSKAVAPNMQGQALGINQGMASLMRTVGPLIAGFLFGININLPFYVGVVMLLLSAFFLITVYRPVTYVPEITLKQPSQ